MKSNYEPRVAPGINYNDDWEDATNDDIQNGNFTEETSLIWDEYDPSFGDGITKHYKNNRNS